MMVLIAGPYRSGTADDPALLQKNVQQMESYALPIFRAGHIPLVGEWLALPLVELAGSKKIGDDAFNEIFYLIAARCCVSAMPCCASEVLPLAPTKWSKWVATLA